MTMSPMGLCAAVYRLAAGYVSGAAGSAVLESRMEFPSSHTVAFTQPRGPIAPWRPVMRPRSLSLVGRRVAGDKGLLPWRDPHFLFICLRPVTAQADEIWGNAPLATPAHRGSRWGPALSIVRRQNSSLLAAPGSLMSSSIFFPGRRVSPGPSHAFAPLACSISVRFVKERCSPSPFRLRGGTSPS